MVRRLGFLFAVLICGILAWQLQGCDEQIPTQATDKPAKASQTHFPERPNIPGGGSNWEEGPRGPKALSKVASVATTDMTVLTPTDLVNALVGTGPYAPLISNVSYTGAAIAAGTFSGGTEAIGFESGIVLSSGNIASVVGPNISDGTTTNNALAGDADLNTLIPGIVTHDAAVLEFDLVCPVLKVISFQYVFASEEYNEYVGSPFNDLFGFFLNGTNIALIPGTSTPVSVNNINCGNPYAAPDGGSYCSLFRNNDLSDGGGSIDTEMDGLTVVLTATAPVSPGVNHIKLVIADASDYNLDSDVFIKAESFTCAPPELMVPVDIKPGSCPNPLNMRDKGVLPVAILGTAEIDVTAIDPSTIRIAGVAPLRSTLEDVSTPFDGPLLDCNSCTALGADGYMDLNMHFSLQAIAAAIGPVGDGDCLRLQIRGNLRADYGATPIRGEDMVRIIKK